jgi:thiamine-monophosphate kinase
MTVAELTERELVARVQQRLPPAPPWLLVGIGDDAAVVEPERNRLEVLTVDALVDGVHFDRRFVPAAAIGHRALAVNLSDLASMGAAPRLALLSLALPGTLPVPDFDALLDGFTALAAVHRMHVVGGNLTRTPGPLVIDVTAIGTVKRRRALTRAGARPGDAVYISGSIGGAAAGLAALAAGQSQVASQPQVDAYLRPEPRIRLGLMLSRNRAASSCVDLSDGLADGVHRLAEASGVGLAIDADALPIDQGARDRLAAHGKDPVIEAVSGGDDYELLFTVPRRSRRRLTEAERHGGVALTRIGECTAERAVVLRRAGAATPLPDGYTHFAARHA